MFYAQETSITIGVQLLHRGHFTSNLMIEFKMTEYLLIVLFSSLVEAPNQYRNGLMSVAKMCPECTSID